jgi:ribonucleoside-diphosphate reductase alpha chain
VAPLVNVAPNLNSENFWYYKEYVKMKMDKVIDLVSTIQKYIDQSISFEWMVDPNIMSPKELYEAYFH